VLTPRLVTVFWRDIPLTVNGQSGRTRFALDLPRRFSRAVDLAAKNLPSSLVPGRDDWRAEGHVCTYDLELEVTTQVARLDAEYGNDRLRRLAENQGRDSRLVQR
jgi:Virulence factor